MAEHYACIQYTRYKSASLERGGVRVGGGGGGGDCIAKNVFSYAFIFSHFIYHHQKKKKHCTTFENREAERRGGGVGGEREKLNEFLN